MDDRHRSGKATIVLSMFKTVVASRGAATIFSHSYGNRSSFWRIRVAIVEVFVAFRLSYGLATTLLQFGHD